MKGCTLRCTWQSTTTSPCSSYPLDSRWAYPIFILPVEPTRNSLFPCATPTIAGLSLAGFLHINYAKIVRLYAETRSTFANRSPTPQGCQHSSSPILAKFRQPWARFWISGYRQVELVELVRLCQYERASLSSGRETLTTFLKDCDQIACDIITKILAAGETCRGQTRAGESVGIKPL